jgi:hypothetical protein
MTADTVRIDLTSAFALAETPSAPELETEGRVRYIVVRGDRTTGCGDRSARCGCPRTNSAAGSS